MPKKKNIVSILSNVIRTSEVNSNIWWWNSVYTDLLKEQKERKKKKKKLEFMFC